MRFVTFTELCERFSIPVDHTEDIVADMADLAGRSEAVRMFTQKFLLYLNWLRVDEVNSHSFSPGDQRTFTQAILEVSNKVKEINPKLERM